MWDILTKVYSDSVYVNKVVNLRSYYLGFRNFDCPYLTSKGRELQKFQVNYLSSNEPTFQCVIPIEGCQTDEDCRYASWPDFWFPKHTCYCKKNACVKHRTELSDQGASYEERQVPFVQQNKMFHGNCAHSKKKCRCTKPDSWTPIWDSDVSLMMDEETADVP